MMSLMLPRRRRDFDLFDSFFGGDGGFAPMSSALMKTDVKEKKDKYLIDIDLPGFDKDNITVDLENGYLSVSAKVDRSLDDSDDEERYVRQERFYGQCARSFYVGEEITRQDIKAAFKNGVLRLTVPKKQKAAELPESQHIEIE